MHEFLPLTQAEVADALACLNARGAARFARAAQAAEPVWPGGAAPVIARGGVGTLECRVLSWGFEPPTPGKPVFNARWEKLCAQQLQGQGFWSRAERCLVPSRGFWEPSPRGDVLFGAAGMPVFLMAGVCRQGRFATLTVPASEDVLPIHPRMPLVLARGDALAWLAGAMLDPARSPALERLHNE